ncbi:N-acetylmuramoyl-L-alanine amidase family protein [Desulfomonile tiedjei]|nr:N-acetylmuramoyl-L-alanine amidase [Desulfomonile tiedjei]
MRRISKKIGPLLKAYVYCFVLIVPFIMVSSAPGMLQKRLSFVAAQQELERLCRDRSGDREQWNSVINAFVLAHVTGKPASKQTLYYAGKASLELYKVSGKPEDLDKAIRYLNDFSRVCRTGPYFMKGLKAAKEAHTLKLKQSGRSNTMACPSSSMPNASAVSQQPLERAAEKSDKLASTHVAADPKSLNNAAKWKPRPALQGNPLYLESAERRSPPERIASLPPTDASQDLRAKHRDKCKIFTIVIDPGHGGKDPGAVSRDGSLKEKDITLEVSKRLKTALEAKGSMFRVVLTREDDKSLALPERTAVANSVGADLFVSIHCNAATDGTSKGIETFYLDKAGSPRAMRLAAKENGIPLVKMTDLEATLLDLMVTSKKTESEELANTLHKAMATSLKRRKFGIRDRGVKRAPFYVLLGAKMPAILVECAFLSNGRDRRSLTTPEYLDAVAQGLAHGAEQYVRGLGREG